jgi:heme exporter protein C
MNNIWKIIILIWISTVIVLAFILPIPYIKGLGALARIIYFHVPMSWVGVLAYLMAMVYGIMYLKKRDLSYDTKASISAELGLVFTILATVTGSIWAKVSWGSFWNWDPRETSIFILLLIYGAYFALRSAIEVEERKATLSAVYVIFAFFTVPFFIFIMPRLLPSLHPGSADDPESPAGGPVVKMQMDVTMRYVFFASLAGFTALYVWIFKISTRLQEVIRKKNIQ